MKKLLYILVWFLLIASLSIEATANDDSFQNRSIVNDDPHTTAGSIDPTFDGASYPAVYCWDEVWDKEHEIGETIILVFDYYPQYINEELEIIIYNPNGKEIGNASQAFTNNSGYAHKTYKISWNTEGKEAGKYKVEVTKKFYSFLEWHEAPTKTTAYITLVAPAETPKPSSTPLPSTPGPTSTPTPSTPTSTQNVIDASGTCGNGLSWSISGTTLTIKGSGSMANYSSGKDIPWWSKYRDKITTVVVEEGVTSIGNRAFQNLSI